MPNLLEDSLGLRLVEQAEDGRDGDVNDGEDLRIIAQWAVMKVMVPL